MKMENLSSQLSSEKTSGIIGVGLTGVKKATQFARAKSITEGFLELLATAHRAENTLQDFFDAAL